MHTDVYVVFHDATGDSRNKTVPLLFGSFFSLLLSSSAVSIRFSRATVERAAAAGAAVKSVELAFIIIFLFSLYTNVNGEETL